MFMYNFTFFFLFWLFLRHFASFDACDAKNCCQFFFFCLSIPQRDILRQVICKKNEFNFGKKIYIQRRIVIRHFFRSFVRELRVGAGQRSTRFRTKGCTANDGHLHYQMQFFTRIPNMYILIALKEVSKCMLRPFFCPSKPNIALYTGLKKCALG